VSGISGLFRLDGRAVDPGVLGAMSDAMTHWGAEARKAWSQGCLGLSHVMRWTTPESLREELPVADDERGLVLTADARIDNRDELLDSLAMRGNQDLVTDSRLILAAYDTWGEACPERLEGDFAFAIWDARNQLLFCARDRFGVRPFYYHLSDRLFAFSSQLKGLLRLEEIPGRVNEAKVADYLGRTELDPATTFYQDVLQLPAAHSISVRRERAPLRRYWAPDASREVRLASDAEYDQALREHLTRAVRARVRSPFPVGSMLSGGLDSSAVVAIARQLVSGQNGGRLHTFSGVFDLLTQCDERTFIEAVVGAGGVEPHYVTSDRLDPWADSDAVLQEQQEPFPNPFLFVRRAICGLARELNVRTLLDGSMGDAVVPSGIARLTELAGQGRWWRFATQLMVLKATVYQNYEVPLSSLAWERGIRPFAPPALVDAWRRAKRVLRPAPRRSWSPIISPGLADRTRLAERLTELRADFAGPARTAREEQRRFLVSGMYHSFAPTGRTAAAFGMSAVHPYADRRLVEFCLALPSEQKLDRGWSRWVFRRAFAELPDAVRWRRDKSNLQPLVMAMLFGPSSRGLVERVVFSEREAIAEYVDLRALREAYLRCAGWERRGGYATRREVDDANHVFRSLVLFLWLRSRHT
jgi:asparagine synthase (glutamine-hydrolysing)